MNSSRSLRTSIVASVAFVVLLFVGLPMLWLVGAKARIRQGEAEALKERKAAQAEHLPLTASDLRRNPPVPDSDNAAPIYQQIFAGFKSKSTQFGTLEKDALNITSLTATPEQMSAGLEAARQWVKLTQPELALMEQAAQKPDCDFNRPWEKGASVLFPEYADMRKMARLLVVKAELLDKDGKPLEALKQIEMGGALVRHLGKEPILIGMLVQIAVEAILEREWQELVNKHGNDTAFLTRAAQTNAAFGELPHLKNALRGEVWFGMSAIEIMKNGTYKEEDYGMSAEEKSQMPKLNPRMVGVYEKHLLSFWRRAFHEMDEAKGDSIKTANVMARLDAETQTAVKTDPAGYAFNAMIFPTFGQAGKKLVQLDAMRRMRSLKIELLKYHAAHGAFPKDLSAFNAKTATDPFTGKPLIYRLQGNGYLLYSVGENGVDDGGQRKVGNTNMADIVTSYP